MNEDKDKRIQQMLEMKEFLNSIVEKHEGAMGGYLSKKEIGGEETEIDSFTFFVSDKKPESELTEGEILPKSVTFPDGKVIATDVIEGLCIPVGYIDKLSYQGCGEADPADNQDKQRPIKGGTSIATKTSQEGKVDNWGTLGCLVVDNDDNTLCALTNAHVACADFFLPEFCGDTPKAANQLTWSNVVNEKIFQGKELDGLASYKESDCIGIVKRYSPIGNRGSYDTSQTSTPYLKPYGQLDSNGRPKIVCDAALIALKESVVSADSWKQQGISTQGSSAPSFCTMSEYVNLMYDSAWGSFGSDVGGTASTPPKMFISSRTTGPKEGDPEIQFVAPMMDITIPYSSSVASAGYGLCRFSEAFSFGLKEDAKGADIYCHNPCVGGDSGSSVWAEINGTWKIVGLVFGSWINNKTKTRKLGFAMPMPIVAQVMNISAWDGNLSSVDFLDTNDAFTVEEVVKPGLGKIDHYWIDDKKYALGGTVLKSKSRATAFEPTYKADNSDGDYLTNIVYNDWLSQADNSIGYEGRLYMNSTNNSYNGSSPVTDYTWSMKTGTYLLSTVFIEAADSPFEGMNLGDDNERDVMLAASGGYKLVAADAKGDISSGPPTCINGDPITWESRNPGIYDSSFKVGLGNSVWALGGALQIPSEFKSFYIKTHSHNYDPIKVSYSDAADDGFSYTDIWDLPGYIAALGRGDITAGNSEEGFDFDNAGGGSEIIPKKAHLIFPIFKWEDIDAAGLGDKAARYLKEYNNSDPDHDHYEGWQMATNSTLTSSTNVGQTPGAESSHYWKTVHKEPTFIPLFCLEPPTSGGAPFRGGTGYQENGWINDTDNNGTTNISARSTARGWLFNNGFNSAPPLFGGDPERDLDDEYPSARDQLKAIDGSTTNTYIPQMIVDNVGSHSWNLNKGYRARYYVLNPKWVAGVQQWRNRNGIPADSSLSTPYGHVFEYNDSAAAGESWADATIDAQLNSLPLLSDTYPGHTGEFEVIVDFVTGSWAMKFA